jgi:uncharacterized repeat protein (TIGR01451 family)
MRRNLGKLAVVALATLVVALPAAAVQTPLEYSSGDVTRTIFDDPGAPRIETLSVSAVGQIADVDVWARIDHANPADLDLVLRHPDNTTVDLSSDNSGGAYYGSGATDCSGTFVKFDDQASGPPAVQPDALLSTLNGKSAGGSWKLEITDDTVNGDSGTLYCWKLLITLAEADLGVTIADEPDPLGEGAQLTYTVTVKNNGPATVTGGKLTLAFPAGTTLSSSTVSQGTCGVEISPLTCELGSMASGATVTAAFAITPPTATATVLTTATVSSGAVDPVPGNDVATASTTVSGGSVGGSETVNVTTDGSGSGTVKSSPEGISCGFDCSAGFAKDTEVSLTAEPSTGSFFSGWGGACAAFLDMPECTVTASGVLQVTATFDSDTEPGAVNAGGPKDTESGGTKASFYICTITGNEKANVLRGTKKRDTICGLGGNDKIYGLGGNDVLIGGAGKDVLVGGLGADTFFSKDRSSDTIRGGKGRDKVKADFRDALLGVEESVG